MVLFLGEHLDVRRPEGVRRGKSPSTLRGFGPRRSEQPRRDEEAIRTEKSDERPAPIASLATRHAGVGMLTIAVSGAKGETVTLGEILGAAREREEVGEKIQ